MKNSFVFLIFIFILACNKEPKNVAPTPYMLDVPKSLPPIKVSDTNPLTVEGIALGKRLFYDPILSGNNSQACGDCHNQKFGFTDSGNQFSIGIDNIEGDRNSMPLFNLVYQKDFFWDGGVKDLESQVIGPILNKLEMHEDLANALQELNAHPEYPLLFEKAFNVKKIESIHIMKAVAQFEKTILSGNSKYDKYKAGKMQLTDNELHGLEVFTDMSKGDCNHCHVLGSTFSDFEYRNNGLEAIPKDLGRGRITLLSEDNGKFKTPTLRNIALTAPYMHDGRIKTLEACVDFYNNDIKDSKTLDTVLKNVKKGRMNPKDKSDLIEFLKTLTDLDFVNDVRYRK